MIKLSFIFFSLSLFALCRGYSSITEMKSLQKAACSDTVFWKESYKLQYSDFLNKEYKKPDSDSNIYTTNAVSCFVFMRRYVFVDGKIDVLIEFFFDKKQSWILKKDSSTLKHEQGHFDLYELYARHYRKRMDDFKKSKNYRYLFEEINEHSKKIYSDIRAEMELENKNFDTFSLGKMNMNIWYDWIRQELKKLEVYKSG